jgi:hypothetical protein
MKCIGLLIGCLLIAGCVAGGGWTHAHGRNDLFQRDLMQCQMWANQMAGYRAATGGHQDFATAVIFGGRVAQTNAGTMDCMQRLGYVWHDTAPTQ